MQLRPSLKFVKLSYVIGLLMTVALGVYILTNRADADPRLVWAFLLPSVWMFATFIRHIQRRLVKITILGDRLRYEAGLFSKTTRSIELIKVQDVRVDQTLGQRMINIGDLSLETAGGTSRIELPSIDRPQEAADHLLGLAKAQRMHPDETSHSGAV
jgi:membrane protein YdbS with pleckstrin-like domain